MTVTGTEVSILYDGAVRNAIRIDLSGAPASDFHIAVQKISPVPVGPDADHELRMDGSEKLLHEWVIEFGRLTGCNGIIADLGIGAPGTVGSNSAGGSAALPPIDGRYVWREPSVGPVTAATASCTPKMTFYFMGGQAVSGSVTFIHAFLGHVQ